MRRMELEFSIPVVPSFDCHPTQGSSAPTEDFLWHRIAARREPQDHLIWLSFDAVGN